MPSERSRVCAPSVFAFAIAAAAMLCPGLAYAADLPSEGDGGAPVPAEAAGRDGGDGALGAGCELDGGASADGPGSQMGATGGARGDASETGGPTGPGASVGEGGEAASPEGEALIPEGDEPGAVEEEGVPTAANSSAPEPAAPAKSGWVEDASGDVYYYDGGSAHTGWLVDGGRLDYGVQRYWFAADGRLVRGSLIDASDAGWWAYARPEGFVVRGVYVDPGTGYVYLADNDGRLEEAGWRVTDAYGQGVQRYWIDPVARAAVPGYSEDGYAHYATSEGYVLRGKLDDGAGRVYLADNDGRLADGEGWIVTGAYDGGVLQRYYLDGAAHAACSGYFSVDGANYFGLGGQGYVLRGVGRGVRGDWLVADNDGVLASSRWIVADSFGQGLQRYWFGKDGAMAKARLVEPGEGAGYWAYATSEGYVLRGKLDDGAGRVYLADNDGRLADGEGWIVTGAYDGGVLQRYYLDGAAHAACSGYFSVDGANYFGLGGQGYVLRGKMLYGTGMLLANNHGIMAWAEGWLVTDEYDSSIQRYRIDGSPGNGLMGAHIGLFILEGNNYYGRGDQGYVVRGIWHESIIRTYIADNDGRLSQAIENADGGWRWVDGSGNSNRDEAIDLIIATARSVLGVPYVWGGDSPNDGGMDCSGLAYYCYKQLGIELSRVTYDYMIGEGVGVSYSEARPGDLIFMYFSGRGPEHVVMYAGNGMVYEEPTFGGHCQYVSLASKHAGYIEVRRIIV
ncbi:NlpC/P60 family protein [Gordonibacter massiliensis (ex Traore et al. 2017)]|uniref:NlpC/P60 family protein n=1 Tax=Gordonibacter massiliensis (ex Traore et al. 2017) TaxID=1841863 RepID=UPI001C8BB8EA|nr:NlpC/P60 family protein [Gordonibacter massiliensis (ex Traore et al. 2017)]MBX9033613.1 hypothetical protein [Gordonibacter massiliensis (ex Traore et al. 2017)]